MSVWRVSLPAGCSCAPTLRSSATSALARPPPVCWTTRTVCSGRSRAESSTADCASLPSSAAPVTTTMRASPNSEGESNSRSCGAVTSCQPRRETTGGSSPARARAEQRGREELEELRGRHVWPTEAGDDGRLLPRRGGRTDGGHHCGGGPGGEELVLPQDQMQWGGARPVRHVLLLVCPARVRPG